MNVPLTILDRVLSNAQRAYGVSAIQRCMCRYDSLPPPASRNEARPNWRKAMAKLWLSRSTVNSTTLPTVWCRQDKGPEHFVFRVGRVSRGNTDVGCARQQHVLAMGWRIAPARE